MNKKYSEELLQNISQKQYIEKIYRQITIW